LEKSILNEHLKGTKKMTYLDIITEKNEIGEKFHTLEMHIQKQQKEVELREKVELPYSN